MFLLLLVLNALSDMLHLFRLLFFVSAGVFFDAPCRSIIMTISARIISLSLYTAVNCFITDVIILLLMSLLLLILLLQLLLLPVLEVSAALTRRCTSVSRSPTGRCHLLFNGRAGSGPTAVLFCHTHPIPADNKPRHNAGSMPGQRRRRWPGIETELCEQHIRCPV